LKIWFGIRGRRFKSSRPDFNLIGRLTIHGPINRTSLDGLCNFKFMPLCPVPPRVIESRRELKE
jgi:hypothetical protein